MANGGFFGGFAESFSAGMQQRRLREQMGMEDERAKRQETIQQQQFQMQLGQRQKEAEAQQEFQRLQAEHQKEQLEIQKKQFDHSISMGFEKAFDPKTPKAYRRYLLTTMARQLGSDPKAPEFNDLLTMINSAEDEELENLRTTIGTILPTLAPGERAALAKTVFAGQMNIQQLTGIADAMRKGQIKQEALERFSGGGEQQQQPTGTEQPQQDGNVRPDGGIDIFAEDADGFIMRDPGDEEETAEQPQSPEQQQPELSPAMAKRQAEIEQTKARRDFFQKNDMMEDARLEEAKLDDLMRAGEMEPELQEELARRKVTGEQEAKLDEMVNPAEMLAVGMPGTQMTKRDAQKYGISVGTMNGEALMKINQQKGAVKNTVRQIAELKILAQKAGPAAIGPVGVFVRSMDSFIEQALAIPDIAKMGNREFRKNTSRLARETFNELPEKSAIIQSRIIDLTRSMARARDTGMLSNQDIEDARRQLAAAGGSMEQFLAVLDDMQDRVLEGGATSLQALFAVKPLDLMTRAEHSEIINAPGVPRMMAEAIRKIQEQRLKESKRLQELYDAK